MENQKRTSESIISETLELTETIRSRVKERLQDHSHNGNDLNNMASALYRCVDVEGKIPEIMALNFASENGISCEESSLALNEVILTILKEFEIIGNFTINEDMTISIFYNGENVSMFPLIDKNLVWTQLFYQLISKVLKG